MAKILPYNGVNNLIHYYTNMAELEMSLRLILLWIEVSTYKQGTDYSYLQNARKLQANEFTLHPQLGFISLNRRLNDGEVLAVAYEYTVVGASNA